MSASTTERHEVPIFRRSLQVTHLVLPLLGVAVSVCSAVAAAVLRDPPQAGEFQGHWWSIAAAIPGGASTMTSLGATLLTVGVVVVLLDRRRVVRGHVPARSPLLRGLAIVAVLILGWSVAAVRAQQSATAFLTDPAARGNSASAQVRAVVAQDALPGPLTKHAVTPEGIAAFGPAVLVTTGLTETTKSGEGVSTDYTMLINPLTGHIEDTWFQGM